MQLRPGWASCLGVGEAEDGRRSRRRKVYRRRKGASPETGKRCLSILPGLLPPVSRVPDYFLFVRGVSLAPLKRGGSTPSLLICHPPRRVLNSASPPIRQLFAECEFIGLADLSRRRQRVDDGRRSRRRKQASEARREDGSSEPGWRVFCLCVNIPLIMRRHKAN